MHKAIEFTEFTVTSEIPSHSSAAAKAVLQGFHLLLEKDMAGFIGKFTDDAVVEYPFAPDGWPKRLHGHAELHAHLHDYPEHLEIQRFRDLIIHDTSDPDVVIAEFIIEGAVTKTKVPYQVQYIEVVCVENGKFKTYKDYWNPLLALSLVPQGLGH